MFQENNSSKYDWKFFSMLLKSIAYDVFMCPAYLSMIFFFSEGKDHSCFERGGGKTYSCQKLISRPASTVGFKNICIYWFNKQNTKDRYPETKRLDP